MPKKVSPMAALSKTPTPSCFSPFLSKCNPSERNDFLSRNFLDKETLKVAAIARITTINKLCCCMNSERERSGKSGFNKNTAVEHNQKPSVKIPMRQPALSLPSVGFVNSELIFFD